MKSAICTVATNVSVAADGSIPVGSIVRRLGPGMGVEGGAISCEGCGYYEVTVCVTMSPTAAGAIGIRLLKDGSEVPGATAMGTGVLNSPMSLTVNMLVRKTCCGVMMLSVALDSDGTDTGALVENMTVTVTD